MKVTYQNWCASKGTITKHVMELSAPSQYAIIVKETDCYNGSRFDVLFYNGTKIVGSLFWDYQQDAAPFEELSIENVKNILKEKMRLSKKNINVVLAYMAAFDVL